MDDLKGALYGAFLAAVLYSIFLEPRIKEKISNSKFDSLVLGFLDAILLSAPRLGCTNFEMRNYVKGCLKKAHSLPRNQHLIEYTANNGFCYRSYTSNGHALFSVLCIAQYAQSHDNPDLLSWCESMMEDSRRLGL